jgi:hypothetical protein
VKPPSAPLAKRSLALSNNIGRGLAVEVVE